VIDHSPPVLDADPRSHDMPSLRSLALPGVLAMAAAITVGAAAANAQQGATLAPSAVNPQVSFVASLTGAQEVPPVTTDAVGRSTVTVNPTTGQICVNTLTTLGEPITMSHIHSGLVGASGPVVVDLAVTSGTKYAKCVVTTPGQAAAIAANPAGFYVNAHTATNPTGELRGQLAMRVPAVGGITTLTEPVRAYDSRQGSDGPLAPNATRVVALATGVDGAGATQAAVPAGAQAAIVTVTVTQTVDSGYVTAYSNSLDGTPATSTVNWTSANDSVAATTTVAVDGEGKIKLTAGPRGTQVIVDVIGYVL
jgi:hypothetical protein